MDTQAVQASDQWWCYRWSGRPTDQGTVAERYDVRVPVPPIFVNDWPKKPVALRVRTCETLDSAVDWLREEVGRIRPQLRPPAHPEAHWESFAEQVRDYLTHEKISHDVFSLNDGTLCVLAIVPNHSVDLRLWPH